MAKVLVVLDTETTSLDVQNGKVIEIGAVALVNDEFFTTFGSLCNPGPGWDKDAAIALRINGIKKVDVEAAPPFEQVRDDFLTWLHELGKPTLTAYNVGYDRPILFANGWQLEDFEWGECVMLAASEVLHKAGVLGMRYGKPAWCSLVKACEYFKIERKTVHRAHDDAVDAAKVWLAIEGLRENTSSYCVEGLHEKCDALYNTKKCSCPHHRR